MTTPIRAAALAALATSSIAAALPAFAQQPDRIETDAATLGLTEAEVRPDDWGHDLWGVLPSGDRVKLEYDRDGMLEEIDVDRGGSIAFADLRPLLPQAVQAPENLGDAMRITSLEIDRDGLEAEGIDENGRRFEAEWAPDGRLRDWDRD